MGLLGRKAGGSLRARIVAGTVGSYNLLTCSGASPGGNLAASRLWALYPIGRGLKGCDRATIRRMPRKARQPAKHPALRALGNRIRELRQQQGISQEALADKASLGRSYMSGIERGVRNCSTLHLIRLARALSVRVGDLFPR